MKTLYCKLASLALVLLPVSFGSASAQQTEALPPAAQQALDKGLAAAKQEQWTIAIQSLDQARQLAPKSPIILFNQALAESRVPGRELRSIVLFHAYLAAAPNAANGAAVKDQIGSLQIKVEGTIQSLLDQAKDITPKLSTASNWGYSDQLTALDDLAKMKARIGDIDGAKQIAGTCKQPLTWQSKTWEESYASQCLLHIVTVQAELGDFDGARATADQAAQAEASRVMNDDMMQYGRPDQDSIAKAAQGTNDQAYESIISDEAKAGRIQAALDDLSHHPSLAEPQLGNPGINLLEDIAEAQFHAGQQQAAELNLGRALENIKQYQQRVPDADVYYIALAQAQLDVGDFEGSIKTISNINPKFHNDIMRVLNPAYLHLAVADWKKGDLNAASKAASQVDDDYIFTSHFYGLKSDDLRAANVSVCCRRDDLLRLIQARADASQLSLSLPPEPVKDPVTKWTSLLGSLNDPLFTDLHYQLQVISAQSTPKAIFDGLLKAVQQMSDASTKIKQTEAELAK